MMHVSSCFLNLTDGIKLIFIHTMYTFQGVNAEIELQTGKMVTVTTDDKYYELVDEENIWVDYKNIVKVLEPENRIFIDDGLISLIVKEKGESQF